MLKEDVARVYGLSWELFVQGSSARKTQMSVANPLPFLHRNMHVLSHYTKPQPLLSHGARLKYVSWCRETKKKQELKVHLEQEKKKSKEDKEEKYSFAKRLAKFAGPSAVNGNYFRVTSAGTPAGILMGTPTFLKVQEREDNAMKQVLYVLERGSSASKSRRSNALSSFQEVLTVLLMDFRISKFVSQRRQDATLEHLGSTSPLPSSKHIKVQQLC